jgi:hypothetical protein
MLISRHAGTDFTSRLTGTGLEPLAALDMSHKLEIMPLIERVRDEFKRADCLCLSRGRRSCPPQRIGTSSQPSTRGRTKLMIVVGAVL